MFKHAIWTKTVYLELQHVVCSVMCFKSGKNYVIRLQLFPSCHHQGFLIMGLTLSHLCGKQHCRNSLSWSWLAAAWLVVCLKWAKWSLGAGKQWRVQMRNGSFLLFCYHFLIHDEPLSLCSIISTYQEGPVALGINFTWRRSWTQFLASPGKAGKDPGPVWNPGKATASQCIQYLIQWTSGLTW